MNYLVLFEDGSTGVINTFRPLYEFVGEKVMVLNHIITVLKAL
jgi:hypothetical protein